MKEKVTRFFDRCAPFWDEHTVKDERIINTILDNAGVTVGKRVLDVATGTGVLIEDYLNRGVASVTAVDISPEMIRIAKSKFNDNRVEFISADVFDIIAPESYDCIVVYNAFPHFFDPVSLLRHLTGMLAPGGTLTVAHGMSREALTKHHSGSAREISIELLHENELAGILAEKLRVTVKISNSEMYQVAAVKPWK